MSTTKKAIFFDVDGTLVSFKTHTISPATINALHALREKGYLLFLSTGRHAAMLGDVRAIFPFDGYITMSGQYCYAGDTVLRKLTLGAEGNRQFVQLAERENIACIVLEGTDIYMNHATPQIDYFLEESNLPAPPTRDFSTILDREIYQVITFVPPEDEERVKALLPDVDTTRWHPHFFDIMPKNGGKHHGVAAVCQHFGIDVADTIAFGDGGNDLTMLQYVACGVAMGSASQEVQEAADLVTGTVDEDGVVSALHQLNIL